MTTLVDNGYPNLSHLARRLGPDGVHIADLVNTLEEENPTIQDIPFEETNKLDSHQVTGVTAIPSGTFGRLNQGVPVTKAETEPFVETCAMLQAETAIDTRHPGMTGPRKVQYLDSENKIHEEGLAQQFASSIYYESVASNPERIHGLTPRYPALSGYLASPYVLAGIDGETNSGSDCLSAWLVTWSQRHIHGIFPQGTMAGLETIDRGVQRVYDSSNRPFYAHCTSYIWRYGIVVRDYRYAARIQIDPSKSYCDAQAKGIIRLLQRALTTIKRVTPMTRLYMNRDFLQLLDDQLLSNEGRLLAYHAAHAAEGLPHPKGLLPHFRQVPIRVDDALITEEAVAA